MSADARLVEALHMKVADVLNDRDTKNEAVGEPTLNTKNRRQFARHLIREELTNMGRTRLGGGEAVLSAVAEDELERAVLNRLFGLGKLQDYIDDPSFTDIHVNGHDVVWLVGADGVKVRGEPVAGSDEELIEIIRTAARRGALSEKKWDFASPTLDLNLPSGDRLHALAWVVQRPSVSIRRHNFELYRLKQLIGSTISESLYEFCVAAVHARMNILVAGGTGAGKTTFLRCLLNETDPLERIVTIEDSLELGLHRFADRHVDLLETEAREANTEGVGAFAMEDLVRNTLRMKPDRVIVGEIRGAEVLPMMLAMSQGSDGSLSTIHADSSQMVFARLAMYMALTVQRFEPAVTNLLVANSLHFVIHLAQPVECERVVTSVREVRGADAAMVASNEIYAPDATGRGVPATSMSDANMARLERAGFDRSWLSAGRGGWST